MNSVETLHLEFNGIATSYTHIKAISVGSRCIALTSKEIHKHIVIEHCENVYIKSPLQVKMVHRVSRQNCARVDSST